MKNRKIIRNKKGLEKARDKKEKKVTQMDDQEWYVERI